MGMFAPLRGISIGSQNVLKTQFCFTEEITSFVFFWGTITQLNDLLAQKLMHTLYLFLSLLVNIMSF